MTTDGAAQFGISRNGSLVYIPGDATGPAKKLVWVDRKGGSVPMAADSRNYAFTRASRRTKASQGNNHPN